MRNALYIFVIAVVAFGLGSVAYAGEIHEAAGQGNLQTVRDLLKKNPEAANERDERGFTPLHHAANDGHTEIMTLLLDTGAEISPKDPDGDTPLHWAAYAGQDEALKLLLRRKADKNVRDNNGWTALFWAVRRNHDSAARILIVAGLEVNDRDKTGITPLHLAANHGHATPVKTLLAHGAKVNVQDDSGDTPLHGAAWAGNREVVTLLIEAGAKTGIKNDRGATPMDNAEAMDRAEVTSLLHGAGALRSGTRKKETSRVKARPAAKDSRLPGVKITILYDNYRFIEGTEPDWGFACLIEGAEKTILFDTGTKPEILMKNVEELKVDLGKVDLIVLSHNHGDHTGGLWRVMEKLGDALVYIPYSFPYDFVRRAQKAGARVIPVKEPMEICSGVFLTGEMGDAIREQSLVLDTEEGLVVVTGCSHSGIEKIVKRAREMEDRKIYLALGGFHLMRHSQDQLKAILSDFKEAGVVNCAATHCTGDGAIAFFKKAYGDNYLPAGTGRVFEIGKMASASPQ